MSIRTKLSLLLLMISLIPMLALNLFSIWTVKEMGVRIADYSSDTLIDREQAYLREKISEVSLILRKNINQMNKAITSQAIAVEKALSENPDFIPVAMTADFQAGSIKTVLEEKYSRQFSDNKQVVPVSFDRPVLHISPGIKESAVHADMARLAILADTYKLIHKLDPASMMWHYTSLKNGLHSTFPGHGAYPADYDPRQNPWYQNAIQSDRLTWTNPIPDIITGRLLNTIAAAVHRPDGSVAGVTAIDFMVLDTLNINKAGAGDLAPSTKVILVRIEDNRKIAIIGEHVFRNNSRRWERPSEKTFINDPDGRIYEQFPDSEKPEMGLSHEFHYNGEKYLWEFTPVNLKKVFLMVGVSMSKIITSAEHTEAFVKTFTHRQTAVIAVALLAIIIIVFIIALNVARGVTKPLAELSSTAEKIAHGALESRVTFQRNDEIGILGQSVNEMADSIEKLINEQETAYMQMLESLSKALEAKDSYTSAHSSRVAENAMKLGGRIGIDKRTMDLLKRGALVHDLGKIGITDNILNKSGPLAPNEFDDIKTHPTHTATIMRPLVRFKEFAEIAEWHHERWDGKGYPDGLKGDKIPLLARIVAIADTWDAMTGDRVYRKGIPAEEALLILDAEKDSGQFDPDLIREFIHMIRESNAAGNQG